MGGRSSLTVSGGCIAPHAVRYLAAPSVPCSVSLSFWGKNLALGGTVGLRRLHGDGRTIDVSVQETVWTRLAPMRRLACLPGDTLVLELMSGGIVYSAMRVDLLEVVADR
jgi:hypothetical protein